MKCVKCNLMCSQAASRPGLPHRRTVHFIARWLHFAVYLDRKSASCKALFGRWEVGWGVKFFQAAPRKQQRHGKENKFTFILKTNISPSGGKLEVKWGERLVVDFHSCPAEFHAHAFLEEPWGSLVGLAWVWLVPCANNRRLGSESNKLLLVGYSIYYLFFRGKHFFWLGRKPTRGVPNEMMFVDGNLWMLCLLGGSLL